MAGRRGFAAVAWLRERTLGARGGQDKRPLAFLRHAPDALAICAEDWLEHLRTRNYAEETLTGRLFGLKSFMLWAEARDVTPTAIYTEVTIRQLLEVHARCHPSGQLPTPGKTA
jgi:hypothetical protein